MSAIFLDAFLSYKVDSCFEILIAKPHSVCILAILCFGCIPAEVSHSNVFLPITVLHIFSLLSYKPCVPFVHSQAPLLSQCLSLGPLRYLLCPELFISFLCPPPYLS